MSCDERGVSPMNNVVYAVADSQRRGDEGVVTL